MKIQITITFYNEIASLPIILIQINGNFGSFRIKEYEILIP